MHALHLSVLALASFGDKEGKYIGLGFTLSVCIPAIETDVERFLPRLLHSIQAQTLPPDEILVFISGILVCPQMRGLTVVCRENRVPQGAAREKLAAMAKGDIISYIDADDQMRPNRIAVIRALFQEYTPKMVGNGYEQTTACSVATRAFEDKDLMLGDSIYDAVQSRPKGQPWSIAGMAHGHISVAADVFRYVHWNQTAPPNGRQEGEDSQFVADVVNYYGRAQDTAVFVDLPLSCYIWRNKHEWSYMGAVYVIALACIACMITNALK